MTFEQEVLFKLGELSERSAAQSTLLETQTKLLSSIDKYGCSQRKIDQARMEAIEKEQKKQRAYMKATMPPTRRRTGFWGAVGVVVGTAIAFAGKLLLAAFGIGGNSP